MIRILFVSVLLLTCINAEVKPTNKNAPKIIKNSDVSVTIDENISDEFDEFEDFDIEYTTPQKRFDPLSGYNSAMTSFNDYAYTYAINPVASGYKNVIDKDVRNSVNNVFDNLLAPVRFVNNLLQGKIQNSLEELFRFTVNTTLGVGGFGDAGKEIFGIERHPEDFGQTLGFYGVGSGFPIVWPILGPSNLRDSFGLAGDYFASPMTYMDQNTLYYSLNAYERLNYVSLHLNEYEAIKKDSIELYPYLQDLYETRRDQLIQQ